MPVLLRTALFTLLVPGTVVGLVPWLILRRTSGFEIADEVLPHVGFGLIGLGLLVYFLCAYDFTFAGRGTPFPLDPPREFVARGLYRYTRNPMYLGFAGLVVGEALVFGSWWLVAYTAVLCVVWHLFVVHHEEPDLRRRFGESYLRYYREVPRWTGARLFGELFENSRRAALWRAVSLGVGSGAGLGVLAAVAERHDVLRPWPELFMFGSAGVFIGLLLITTSALALSLLAKFRARGLATAITSAMCGVAVVVSYGVSAEPWQKHWERVAARGEPLIQAIRRYESEHGAPPSSLALLLGGFIREIPSTGSQDRTFDYWVVPLETEMRRVWYDLGSRRGLAAQRPSLSPLGDPEHAVLVLRSSRDGIVRTAHLDRLPATTAPLAYDRESWRANPERRLAMAERLVETLAPVGQPLAELVAELGPPDGDEELPVAVWSLRVTGSGMFTWFVYHSDERYPGSIGGSFEPIGKWAYVRE